MVYYYGDYDKPLNGICKNFDEELMLLFHSPDINCNGCDLENTSKCGEADCTGIVRIAGVPYMRFSGIFKIIKRR